MTGIVDKQIALRAGIQVSKLKNRGFETNLAPLTLGTTWYVDSNSSAAVDSSDKGTSEKIPFATIGYAVTQAAAGDVILVKESHTESVSIADAWKWAAAGIYVLGLGWGNIRPTITFDTLTTATILMDTASCVIDNCRFVVGVDSLALMIDISAAANIIKNCEFILDDSALQALNGITFSAATADRCKILGCNFESINADCANAIEIAAALTDLEIAYTRIFGDFSDACIQNDSGSIAKNLFFHDNDLANTQSGDHAVQLESACTGQITENRVNSSLAATGSLTALDGGSCYMTQNFGHDAADNTSGLLNPVADS